MSEILIAIGALIVSIGAAFVFVRNRGKSDERNRNTRETLDRVQRGQDSVAQGRDDGSPADRLRRNDGRW